MLSQIKINVTNAYISVIAFFGLLGPTTQAFSPFLAIAVAFVLSPLLAVLTKGKFYIARENTMLTVPTGKELLV